MSDIIALLDNEPPSLIRDKNKKKKKHFLNNMINQRLILKLRLLGNRVLTAVLFPKQCHSRFLDQISNQSISPVKYSEFLNRLQLVSFGQTDTFNRKGQFENLLIRFYVTSCLKCFNDTFRDITH